MAAQAPELPPEILFRILASVPKDKRNEGYAKTLSACAVVCRSWLEEACRFLYHHVVISKWDQYSRLSRTLTQNPALAALVHKLHLWIDIDHGLGYTEYRYVPFNPHAVGLLVNLQDLAVQSKPAYLVPDEFMPFIWSFATCRSLRTIRLLGLQFPYKSEFDRTLWSFPDVTTVQLSDCRWDTAFSGHYIDEEYRKGTAHFLRLEDDRRRFWDMDALEEEEGLMYDEAYDEETDDEESTEGEENDEDSEDEESVEEDRGQDAAGTRRCRWYPYRTLDDLEIRVWKSVQNTLLTFGPRVKKLSLQLKPKRETHTVSMAAIQEYVDLEHLALEFWGTDTAWVPAALSNVRAKNLQTLMLTHYDERSSRKSILEAWDGLHLDGILAGFKSSSDLGHLSMRFVWSEMDAGETEVGLSQRVRSLFPQCIGLFEVEFLQANIRTGKRK